MNERQFRAAIQANIKCGKRELDRYCKNHDPEYTDQEYNEIIMNNSRFWPCKRTISITNHTIDKLIKVVPEKKMGRKRKTDGDDV